MAGGVQATQKKLPQLLSDGLSPAMHLQAAMCVQNPLTYVASTTVAVKYALANAPNDFNETCERRKAVAATIRLIAAACDEENERMIQLCEPSVAAVLRAFGTKNIALMRELAYVCGAQDIASPALLLLGLPMIGWAPGAEGLMRRTKEPLQSVEDVLERRPNEIKRLSARLKLRRTGSLTPRHTKRRRLSRILACSPDRT